MATDDPSSPGGTPQEAVLQGLFNEAKSDLPSSAQLQALAAKLGPILEPGAASTGQADAAGASAASGGAGALAVKV